MPCLVSRPARIFSISSAGPKPFSTMLAPWAASAWAMPRPMPLVEPVTTAHLPLRLIYSPDALLFEQGRGSGGMRRLGLDLGAYAGDLGLHVGDVVVELLDRQSVELARLGLLFQRFQIVGIDGHRASRASSPVASVGR